MAQANATRVRLRVYDEDLVRNLYVFPKGCQDHKVVFIGLSLGRLVTKYMLASVKW
jgi:hypothetical protein